jgi:ABC-type polysaccharide/polyol phosphate transport system ATPase subunit
MVDLSFSHVSKRYSIAQDHAAEASQSVLRRKLQRLMRSKEDFWALKDVSFEVERGEALGIIGHNGAGKSTILKLLSNVTTPTRGEITIQGKLSALIEVGSGFHPELTGRENVYLSGSILGMARREISAKLESIAEFAGLKQFMDVPVKRYSSGMYVRLGFSIAAHLEPDILLLDEVLAVGDASFQAKCLQRIDELKRSGTTIVFISHDLAAVRNLCDRVLLMQRGEVVTTGSPADVIREYEQTASKFRPSAPRSGQDARNLAKTAKITGFSFFDTEGRETSALRTGDAFTARVEYVVPALLSDAVFTVNFHAESGELCCQLSSARGEFGTDLPAGRGAIEFVCSELGLQPGLYHVDLAIEQHPRVVDWQYHCAVLHVEPGRLIHGQFFMPHDWRMVEPKPDGETENCQASGKVA